MIKNYGIKFIVNYWPVNLGGRFSKNEETPSQASLLWKTTLRIASPERAASKKLASMLLKITSLVQRTAKGPKPAKRSAHA